MVERHWTERSTDDFVHRLSSDFIVQLEKRIEAEQVAQKELASRLGLSDSAVSQTLNTPGNLELRTMVQYARVLGMKVAVIAYDDADPDNTKGPIISEVFTECWQRLGKPQDFFDLQDTKAWILHTTHVQSTTTRRKMSVKVEKLAETDNIRKIYA